MADADAQTRPPRTQRRRAPPTRPRRSRSTRTSSPRSSSSPVTTAPMRPPTWPAACACSTRRNIRMIKLPCTGKLEVIHLLKALEAGADGVYAAGCLEGECHYLKGNLWARKRVNYVKTLLAELGIEPERVEMYNMSSAMGAKFAEVATEFTERIKQLGPNPVKRGVRRTPPRAKRSAARPCPTIRYAHVAATVRKDSRHDHRRTQTLRGDPRARRGQEEGPGRRLRHLCRHLPHRAARRRPRSWPPSCGSRPSRTAARCSVEHTAAIRQCEWEYLDMIAAKVGEADVVLSMACGIGIQSMAEKFAPKLVAAGREHQHAGHAAGARRVARALRRLRRLRDRRDRPASAPSCAAARA